MKRYHNNKIVRTKDYLERRENAMRPSKYLGYDHDHLGVYLMAREAFAIAEVEFRRAIWLNPFAMPFKLHLALCLYEQKRWDEAENLARQIQRSEPDRRDVNELLQRLETRTA